MIKELHITRRSRIAVCVMMLIAMSTVSYAGVETMAQLRRKGSNKMVTGMTRYLASSKIYKMIVKNPKNPKITVNVDIAVSDVTYLKVKEPANYKDLQRKVAAGQYSSAVTGLEKMRKDYLMMEYDVKAASLLVEVYVKLKQTGKCVRVCREIMKANPNVLSEGKFFMYYSEALMAEGQDSTLKAMVEKVIANAPRPSVAEAHIIRGDMYMKKGEFKKALIDGYLRNIVLFRDEKNARPRALSKAIKCFEQLGENNNAEAMRKMLQREFPDYASN